MSDENNQGNCWNRDEHFFCWQKKNANFSELVFAFSRIFLIFRDVVDLKTSNSQMSTSSNPGTWKWCVFLWDCSIYCNFVKPTTNQTPKPEGCELSNVDHFQNLALAYDKSFVSLLHVTYMLKKRGGGIYRKTKKKSMARVLAVHERSLSYLWSFFHWDLFISLNWEPSTRML